MPDEIEPLLDICIRVAKAHSAKYGGEPELGAAYLAMHRALETYDPARGLLRGHIVVSIQRDLIDEHNAQMRLRRRDRKWTRAETCAETCADEMRTRVRQALTRARERQGTEYRTSGETRAEILGLLARGLTQRQAARSLGIVMNTLTWHLTKARLACAR